MANVEQIKAAIAQEEEPVTIKILQKDGEPYLARDGSPATISVVGSESKRYRDLDRRQTRLALRWMSDNGGAALTLEQADANRLERATACVTGWHGWEEGDTDWPCMPDNVRALLSYDFILRQVEKGIEKHASFFAARSAS